MIQVPILKKDYYLIIGLAICRRIMEHHGGGISRESKVGKGSTFHNIGERWEKVSMKAF